MTELRKDDRALLTTLLRDVSRSFYLTLSVLPRAVRSQIGLAYLLARATDTIADTDALPVAGRLSALAHLRARILGESTGSTASSVADAEGRFRELAGQQALPAERRLLERMDDALTVLRGFAPADQRRIREVLATITSGQELDLRRFEGAGPNRVIALRHEAELDDYTYRVAGCVGEFWTRMCVAHLFPEPSRPASEKSELSSGESAGVSWFESSGVRFGQGLQLVNILRDLPRDLQQGRCYLPTELLDRVGLSPDDLLNPGNEGRLRQIYDPLVEKAQQNLRAGWSYTCALPSSSWRLRLACAWPILIGVRTLSALRAGRVLDPRQRIKVSKAEVRGILFRSVVSLPIRRTWERQFEVALQ